MKTIFIIAASFLIAYGAFGHVIDNSQLDTAILKADRIIETDTRVFFKNVESIIVNSQGEIKFENTTTALTKIRSIRYNHRPRV
ncbi:MAG: hypothetical protein L0Y76_11115 [Ignavibacteria bacterium]|nr:hypothetical protein [Ignavibacteria bacterium]